MAESDDTREQADQAGDVRAAAEEEEGLKNDAADSQQEAEEAHERTEEAAGAGDEG
ncbi:MAG: hypothetical protein JWN49_33 [Parcubacteria group bacterium]|nr:hypothetical protein [Parcubacteria group bacterium]MDB5245437.1 hypothetical protein [Parcubacteria group bacterium]